MIRRPPRSTLFPYNDALPIYCVGGAAGRVRRAGPVRKGPGGRDHLRARTDLLCHGRLPELPASERRHLVARSEEHTSELQSRQYLVCRLLLEKKKKVVRSRYL